MPDLSAAIQRAARAGHQFDRGRAAPAPSSPAAASGRAIPTALRQQLESGLGSDFSDVRLHESDDASFLDARAFTRGRHITFAPGQLNLHSAQGRALLGHELTHVVQQRRGAVATGGARSVNRDPALEREADRQGHAAARGEPAEGSAPAPGVAAEAGSGPAGPSVAPIQLNGNGSSAEDETKKKTISKAAGLAAETHGGKTFATAAQTLLSLLPHTRLGAKATQYLPFLKYLKPPSEQAQLVNTALEASASPINAWMTYDAFRSKKGPKKTSDYFFQGGSLLGDAGAGLAIAELYAMFAKNQHGGVAKLIHRVPHQVGPSLAVGSGLLYLAGLGLLNRKKGDKK